MAPQTAEIPKIQSTTNYAMFQLMAGNRAVNYNHVKELKRSIEAHPELLPVNPIEVNEHMFILDGQHRREACRELGKPVYYIVNRGGSLDATRIENVTQRRWTLMDFAHSYAEGGNKHYQTFLRLAHDYPNVQASVIQNILSGGELHEKTTTFRRGEFQIVNESEAKKTIERLNAVVDKTHHKFNTPMATTLYKLIRDIKEFDYDHFMSKLDNENARELFRMESTRRRCIQSIENVYSFHSKHLARFY